MTCKIFNIYETKNGFDIPFLSKKTQFMTLMNTLYFFICIATY